MITLNLEPNPTSRINIAGPNNTATDWWRHLVIADAASTKLDELENLLDWTEGVEHDAAVRATNLTSVLYYIYLWHPDLNS